MSLKIGPVPDRAPVKVSLVLPPEAHDALLDYAALHARTFGRESAPAELAALMIDRFLKSDRAFQRARKSLRDPQTSNNGASP